MKTNVRYNKTILPQTRWRDNVILLGDLEFGMPKWQLESIKRLHERGKTITEIAECEERNLYEVVVALLHLKKSGHMMGPLHIDDTLNSLGKHNGGFRW